VIQKHVAQSLWFYSARPTQNDMPHNCLDIFCDSHYSPPAQRPDMDSLADENHALCALKAFNKAK
jgi:hypothetical protein